MQRLKRLPVNIALCHASSAEGDSGGPLLIPNRFGGRIAAGNPEFDQVVGITSTGPKDCTDTSPTIYTSIGAFWEWILEKIGEGPEVNCFLHCFRVSDHPEQEKDQQNHVKRPSSGEDDKARTPKRKRPTNKKGRKEELKQQRIKEEIKEERKQQAELSQKKLIKVALIVKIVGNAQMIL